MGFISVADSTEVFWGGGGGEGCFLGRHEEIFTYSDLASPFEELCVKADSAEGDRRLVRRSKDFTAARYVGRSHGKF